MQRELSKIWNYESWYLDIILEQIEIIPNQIEYYVTFGKLYSYFKSIFDLFKHTNHQIWAIASKNFQTINQVPAETDKWTLSFWTDMEILYILW